MSDTSQNSKQRFVRTAGRTLLVQQTNNSFDSNVLNSLEGLQSTHHTEKSNSYFLTFESLPHSLSAFRELKSNHSDNVRVKFAHYRIFFTLQGLSDSSDYTQVKTTHSSYINELGGSVLYYKLYRKEGSYLDCGDLTIDTKETFDLLVNADGSHKEFKLTVGDSELSGTHYRYNRRSRDSTENTATA